MKRDDQPSAARSAPLQFLLTIDRDCRTLFRLDRARGVCEPVVDLEQRLDRFLEERLSADARAWNRGLKSIRQIPSGFVVCDIFGVYMLDREFKIERYLSIPQFTDLHSAIPTESGLLVSNTGVDQALWVNWDGEVTGTIDLHRWFPATPWMAQDLAGVREKLGGDLRLMPLDWARESCHLNWAEETPLGTMLSCFIQGDILFFRDGRPARRVPARAKCHAPCYRNDSQSIVFSASEENRIVEIDLQGREIWSMDGFQFAKHALPLPGGKLMIADTGNRRVVEVDRRRREIVWECSVPGTPYNIEPLRQGQ